MTNTRDAARPKVCSLVFKFAEEIHSDGGVCGPEPDFPNWANAALSVDVAISSDEAACDRNTAGERAAWQLYHDAIEATASLLRFRKRNPALFRKVASQLLFLPCLKSRHPGAETFNRRLFDLSRCGESWRLNPRHLVRQSWPVRYAYAIINTIDLTLDTFEPRLPEWAQLYGFGIKHPLTPGEKEAALASMNLSAIAKYRIRQAQEGAYLILPLWTKGLEKLRRPFNTDHVLDYWRTGKELILEEMPDFHEGPEWADYRNRRAYQTGAKRGAIQHAIFKDILAALRTIAGANQKNPATPNPPP
jgi:hypothetical protein